MSDSQSHEYALTCTTCNILCISWCKIYMDILLWCKCKVILNHKTHRLMLIPISLAIWQTPVYTVRTQIQASALHGVPVYVPAFAGSHCAYPQRYDQLSRSGWHKVLNIKLTVFICFDSLCWKGVDILHMNSPFIQCLYRNLRLSHQNCLADGC